MAFDISDYEYRGEREVGFIPRPRRFPSERLLADPTLSAPTPSIARWAVRSPGFFLMAHGYWVDPDVGHAITKALREQRVRLPERDAHVLLRWDHGRYMF